MDFFGNVSRKSCCFNVIIISTTTTTSHTHHARVKLAFHNYLSDEQTETIKKQNQKFHASINANSYYYTKTAPGCMLLLTCLPVP